MIEKHRKYCQFIVEGESAASAARKAGYAKSSANNYGSELGKREDIKAEIARLQAKTLQKSDKTTVLTALEVRQRLSYIAEDESNKPQDRIRALELLGKTLNMFADKPDTQINIVMDSIKDISYDELQALEAKLTDPSS
jgi:hypothetical protein